jgi:transcriptional regulator with XRE-family HTH domain
MYPNLRAEMARKKVTGQELAKRIGITNGTFSQKFNGKFDFTLDEAQKIKKALGTDISIEELFEPDEQ